MSKTTIGLYLTSGTIFTTSGTIDLYDDVPISLNYNIADVKDPQMRDADYSKTITVPGSNNNNKLFAHIYEIGVDRLYNPNHKIEARIFYDNTQVMKGFMRMARIRKLRDAKIEYDIEIKGRIDDLFTSIKDKLLTDLTWTDLNHTYNQTSITNSWSSAVGSNYVYPFINYAFKNSQELAVSDFRPATYIKEIWDRIFSYAGFQYTSAFLTGDFFKRLIMPMTQANFNLTEAEISEREFRATRATTDQTYTFVAANTYEYVAIGFNDDSTSPNKDTGGNYNTSTFEYTVPTNGYYTFSSNISLTFIKASGADVRVDGWARIIKNNVAVAYSRRVIDIATIIGRTQDDIIITYSNMFLLAGDVIYCDLQMYVASVSGTPSVKVLIGSSFKAQIQPLYAFGDTIVYSTAIPSKIKMSDFLIAIIKMFNLYIEYDKDVPNKLLIAPRNDFYTSTIQDWSGKLDASQEPEITPMGALDAKRYIFKYKKDNDWLNKKYQDAYSVYNETYGQRIKDVDNDFLQNDKTHESIFSASPLWAATSDGRKFPVFAKIDEQQTTLTA